MADTHETLQVAYLAELRAKYTSEQIEEMGKQGHAFKNPDGSYSYPIGDEEDLKNAIRAVGRGNADHNAIRKYVMGRAKDLGCDDLIPSNWNSDGSLEETKSARSLEWRKTKAGEMRGSERRTFHLERAELRSNPDGSLHLSGYASVTGSPYDMGWYTESIKRGAFGKTLSENPDVQLLINHEGLPIARTGKNMSLTEDNTGLRVEADLDPDDPDVQRLAPKMDAGLVDQMSFAFRATRQAWNEDYTDREIQECDIHRGDVSVVNQGANPATSVSLRSWDDVASAVMELRGNKGIPADKRAALVEMLGAQLPGEERLGDLLTELTELRVGKTISKDTGDKIQSAIDTLTGLVSDPDDDDGPDPDADPDDGDEHLSLPPFDMRAERARLEARRYGRAA